jgi:hypothetical protein
VSGVAAGGRGVPADEQGDGVAAERPSAVGEKKRLVWAAGALVGPPAQDVGGLRGQRRDALFAALAGGLDVRRSRQVRVLAAERDELGYA